MHSGNVCNVSMPGSVPQRGVVWQTIWERKYLGSASNLQHVSPTKEPLHECSFRICNAAWSPLAC
eukprot:19446-Pelagomonas_calceolata.AAC.4